MQRIIFRLSMPNVGSWNGKWTGSDQNYFKVFRWGEKMTRNFFAEKKYRSFYYNFGDGWGARIEVSIVPVGTKLLKSDGFCGYDWMINSILLHGEIIC